MLDKAIGEDFIRCVPVYRLRSVENGVQGAGLLRRVDARSEPKGIEYSSPYVFNN
jgi:hypothetical protein